MKEIYTCEAVEEVINTINTAEDCVKFAYSSNTVEKSAELIQGYKDLRDACLEFVNSFDYYSHIYSSPVAEDDDVEVAKRAKAYTTLKAENFVKVFKYE